jgi:hypothetical protein
MFYCPEKAEEFSPRCEALPRRGTTPAGRSLAIRRSEGAKQIKPGFNRGSSRSRFNKTFLANRLPIKQYLELLCHRRFILRQLSVSRRSRWRSKSTPDEGTPTRSRWSDCRIPRSKRAKIGSPPPFPTARCAGRTEKGSPSTWPRPMSARKGPALTCQSPLAC